MDAALRERTREAMAQTDAIFALEGFEPTPESRVVNAAILDGRVTIPQLIAEMRGMCVNTKPWMDLLLHVHGLQIVDCKR